MRRQAPQWKRLLAFMVTGHIVNVRNAAMLLGIYCLHKRIDDIQKKTGIVLEREIKRTTKGYIAIHYIKNPEQWTEQLQKAGVL